MFYESERIVNKQLKYAKTRAYSIIQDLESKGLDDNEIIACINLLKKDSTEFQLDVLDFALKTVTLRQEQVDVETSVDSTYCFTDGRVQPKPSSTNVAPARKKRKTRSNSKD